MKNVKYSSSTTVDLKECIKPIGLDIVEPQFQDIKIELSF